MTSKLEKLLADGLSAGYAGKSSFDHITRGPFEGDQSSFNPGAGETYIDQWFARLRGGGQELAQNNEGKITRVYAGGVIYPERLAALGITEQQVLAQHQKVLKELGGKTRLREKALPEADGDWKYEYTILESFPEVRLDVGLEVLYYKGTSTFIHVLLQSPIE